MIKRTRIGKTKVFMQASYHYRHTRIIGISLNRMETILPDLPNSIHYGLTINLWKYLFRVSISKENK